MAEGEDDRARRPPRWTEDEFLTAAAGECVRRVLRVYLERVVRDVLVRARRESRTVVAPQDVADAMEREGRPRRGSPMQPPQPPIGGASDSEISYSGYARDVVQEVLGNAASDPEREMELWQFVADVFATIAETAARMAGRAGFDEDLVLRAVDELVPVLLAMHPFGKPPDGR